MTPSEIKPNLNRPVKHDGSLYTFEAAISADTKEREDEDEH